MIETTKNEIKPTNDYPILKRYANYGSDYIVLFTDRGVGVTVHISVDSGLTYVGDNYSKFDESLFSVYDGEVTLKNK